MREHRNIFSEKEIKAKVKNFFPNGISDEMRKKLKIIDNWQENLISGKYVIAKEEEISSLFLNNFFGKILDYKYDNPDNWNLRLENKTELDGTKADAAMGYFKIKDKKELPKDVRVVIEVKNAKTPLDLKQVRIKSLSPVEQGFMYSAKSGENCNWVIISNFVEIRLYHANDMTKYESFDIMSLHKDYEFLRFYYLLSFGQLFIEKGNSKIDILLAERLEHEKNIENEFYEKYQYLRELFFYHLKTHNPKINKLKLLEYAQTIIDRVIFIAVVKDYELIPYNVINEVTDISEKSWEKDQQELWRQVKKLFIAIDEGFSKRRMQKFNGGLFKNNEEINNLIIKDIFLKELFIINNYDFKSDLDVNILGHIFEQSITDLEEFKLDIIENQKYEYIETETEIELKIPKYQEGKRKKDGIFYTPEEITNYIVKETIGKLLNEKKDKIGINNFLKLSDRDKSKEMEMWKEYKKFLENIKILDPACGSGAFLSQAYNFLLNEWQTLLDIYEKLGINKIEKNTDALFNYSSLNRQKTISKIKKHIVNNNIFGVDLNFESVKITKLALWIKSANKNDVLAVLDENIKCGNSLISDKKISKNAFVWEKEFKEIMDNGGFDIIVGNPPYVGEKGNKDIFRPLQKEYKEKYTKNSDLIYFFFFKAINLLKNNGLASFITTNYYLSADSANVLRKEFKEKTFIYHIINFNEIKLFKDARGQHNMITFFRKTNEIQDEKISIINVITNKNLSFSQIFESKNKEEVDFFYKKNIFEGKNNYIRAYQKNVFLNSIFKKMLINSKKIEEICFVNTGFNTGADKITSSNFIKKNKGKIGDGIFVIDENEYKKINPEDELIKKCYKSSDIEKYYSTKWQKLYVIYTNKDTKIDDFPKIKNHLKKHKKYLEIKREYKTGQLPWFTQHWSRNIEIFTDKNKIVFPYRSSSNKFSFSENDFFGSKDVLFLRMQNSDFEIKYLLALLNSKLFYNWLFYNGKRKGKTLELYVTPIKQIPIKNISIREQKFFVKLINKLINSKIKLSDYLDLYDKTDKNNFDRQIKINKIIEEQKIIIEKSIKKIDEKIYKIYKIKKQEIEIIENIYDKKIKN